MITLEPVRRGLVPVDSGAAARITGPNYDEFQGDREIWDLLQEKPSSILRVTMAHCDVPSAGAWLKEGSAEALERARGNMVALVESGDTREVANMLWVYEIACADPGTRQIGIGGMARIGEIRTKETPNGVIVRNEGVREPKARGRADLIEHTNAYVGVVNNAIEDRNDVLLGALDDYAQGRNPDLTVDDENGYRHSTWLVTSQGDIDRFCGVLADEPLAFVADGNHRSAAAAMLGRKQFLSVFFPARTMGIAPYNRLVMIERPFADFRESLASSFAVEELGDITGHEPTETHDIGFYAGDSWLRLVPRPATYDPDNAVEVIDADIVQRKLFGEILGITDPADERLRYVGANKSAEYLRREVDGGRAAFAVTLPAVTMEQFMEVCRQNRFMPPKSTWFVPKVRSGLVIALLD